MQFRTLRSTGLALGAATFAAFGLGVRPAAATPITYTFVPGMLDDGGSFTGSFTLDPDTLKVYSYDFTTTAATNGSGIPALTLISSGPTTVSMFSGPVKGNNTSDLNFYTGAPGEYINVETDSGSSLSDANLGTSFGATFTENIPGTGTSDDTTLTAAAATPEPSQIAPFALLVLALGGLALRARKRQNAAA